MSAAITLLLFLARAAAAGEVAPDSHLLLQRGIALHREAAYAASVAALEQARQGRPLEPSEQTECAFYLAADYVALNSLQAARRELRVVLEAAPGYELPQYTSPKVAMLFREVRDEVERLPRLRALPPRRRGAQRIELWFEPSRTGGTAYGSALWRWRGELAYREAPLAHVEDKLMAQIALDRNGMLEYYAEARAPAGAAQAASRDRPLELPISGIAGAPPASPLVENGAIVVRAPANSDRKRGVAHAWWLWTAVGAVAAAGVGVGLYFALRPPSTGTANAVLDFQVR